ncbi:MAG: hypothetical protein V1870_01490 [Candidatus Aenigmatarchaeota archaeon]
MNWIKEKVGEIAMKALEPYDTAVHESKCNYSRMQKTYEDFGANAPDRFAQYLAACVFPSVFGFKNEPDKWKRDAAIRKEEIDEL